MKQPKVWGGWEWAKQAQLREQMGALLQDQIHMLRCGSVCCVGGPPLLASVEAACLP